MGHDGTRYGNIKWDMMALDRVILMGRDGPNNIKWDRMIIDRAILIGI